MASNSSVSADETAVLAGFARPLAKDASIESRPAARRARYQAADDKWASAIGLLLALLVGQPSRAETGSPPAAQGTPEADDPCDGLFAVMDRPTIADSSCAVKPGHLLTELGYTNAAIKGSDVSRAANFPQAALRYGFAEGWEFRLFPANYDTTDIRGVSGGGRVDGLGDTAFGAKYQIGTFSGFTIATDAKLTVPSGRDAFSGGGVQGDVQTMISYNLTPKLGVLLQLSASSLTERADNGRVDRYGDFGANLVVGYQLSDRFQLFSELYGNSLSGPRSRGNLSYLGGIQYLVTKSFELDVGAGTLLSGPQGQQARFFQVGTGLYF